MFNRLTLLLLVFSLTASAEIIPADRRTIWQGAVGVSGGIPARATVCTTITPGATTTQINDAIANCNANETVLLTAGIYSLSGSILINKNITLRGAGPGSTIINSTSGSTRGAIIFNANAQPYNYSVPAGMLRTISAGATQGSTSITVNNNTNIAIGCLLMIDQLNGTWNNTDGGSTVTINGGYPFGGNATWVSRPASGDPSETNLGGGRAQGQLVEVTSVVGTVIGITPPLYINYTRTPEAVIIPLTSLLRNAGVENLTVRSNGVGKANYHMNACSNCWIKNVEGDYCAGDHVNVNTSYRCEIRDSYFHDAYGHGSGESDAVVGLFYKSSACLIENNILHRMHYGILINWGAAGNVIGYNYSKGHWHYDGYPPTGTDTGTTDHPLIADCAGHGAHPMFNLWEGNCTTEIWADSIWGSNSHGTLLRNWVKGTSYRQLPTAQGRTAYNPTAPQILNSQQNRAVVLDSRSLYYNVVGNVLGTTGFASADNYQAVAGVPPFGFRGYGPMRYIFSYGFGGGGGGDGGGTAGNTRLPYDTVLNHGNWDSSSGTQKFDPLIADHVIPNSYYLTDKPSWFGNLSWPPYDPTTGSATMSDTRIPAGYRFANGTPPPNGTPSPTPTATATATASPAPTPTPTPTPLPGVIPHSGWGTPVVDSQELVAEGGQPAINIKDDNSATMWHSQWECPAACPSQPHQVVVDLGNTYNILGFKYLPRQDGTLFGRVKNYNFLVSTDNITWTNALTGTPTPFPDDTHEQTVNFALKTAKYVKFIATSAYDGDPFYTAVAELNVLYSPTPTPTATASATFPSGTPSPTATATFTPSATSTPTATSTSTPSATATIPPTPTPSPTVTPPGTYAGIVEVPGQRISTGPLTGDVKNKSYPHGVKPGNLLVVAGASRGDTSQTYVQIYDSAGSIWTVSFGTSSLTTTSNTITFVAWAIAADRNHDGSTYTEFIVVNPAGSNSNFSWSQDEFTGNTGLGFSQVEFDAGTETGSMSASTEGVASGEFESGIYTLFLSVLTHDNSTVVTSPGTNYTLMGKSDVANSTSQPHCVIFSVFNGPLAAIGTYAPSINYTAGAAVDHSWSLQSMAFKGQVSDFIPGANAVTYNPKPQSFKGGL